VLGLARARDLALFATGLVFAVALHVTDPAETSSFPTCPFFAITGRYCPGCGTLRCLHALLHADLRSAVGFNAMTVILLPAVLTAWLSVGSAGIRGRRPVEPWRVPRWMGWAVAGALAVFWVLRNLPVGAFSWMAP
jgi:hypothetical protein